MQRCGDRGLSVAVCNAGIPGKSNTELLDLIVTSRVGWATWDLLHQTVKTIDGHKLLLENYEKIVACKL